MLSLCVEAIAVEVHPHDCFWCSGTGLCLGAAEDVRSLCVLVQTKQGFPADPSYRATHPSPGTLGPSRSAPLHHWWGPMRREIQIIRSFKIRPWYRCRGPDCDSQDSGCSPKPSMLTHQSPGTAVCMVPALGPRGVQAAARVSLWSPFGFRMSAPHGE